MRVGDAANVVVLLNATAFLGAVVLQNAGLYQIFSDSFQADGFCVSWKTHFGGFVQSHILAFYVDVVCVVILGILCLGRVCDGSDRIRKNLPGIIGHGAGHLSIWGNPENFGGQAGYEVEMSVPKRVASVV